VTTSAHGDVELQGWLRWAAEGGNMPMLVRTLAEAALNASSPDYELRRPLLIDLKRRHPSPHREFGFLCKTVWGQLRGFPRVEGAVSKHSSWGLVPY
jgi:hypothetical protein